MGWKSSRKMLTYWLNLSNHDWAGWINPGIYNYFFLSENASDVEIIVEQANYAFLNHEKIAKKWTFIALH